jgi:hypothetical protein
MHHLLILLKILIIVKLVILTVTAIILFRPFMHNWRGNRGRALRA